MKQILRGLQAEARTVNRAVYMMVSTPDGKTFMAMLEKLDGKILKKDRQGTVDPYAMAYAAGQHDLIQTIKDMRDDGYVAR